MDGEQSRAPLADRLIKAFVLAVVLLGLAALILVPFISSTGGGYDRNDALIKLLEDGCRVYRIEFGVYPGQDADLGTATLVRRLSAPRVLTFPDGSRVTKKGLVEFNADLLSTTGQLLDSWGRPFRYRNPGVRNPKGVDVESAGKNGRFGDDDDLWYRPLE